MKLEAGKFYKTRDGRKVGPMTLAYEDCFFGDGRGAWRPDGTPYYASAEYTDSPTLISEWPAEPDYMDGSWHDWHGGECPVPGDVKVEVEYNDGGKDSALGAARFDWKHVHVFSNITRFRVLNPQPTQTGPVRTVTRKEIVPGRYNGIDVGNVNEAGVHVDFQWVRYTSAELTTAIETLTAIRDALAEQG